MQSIYEAVSELQEEYSSKGRLNSHGRLLVLRFGEIACSRGLLRSASYLLKDDDIERCLTRMKRVLDRAEESVEATGTTTWGP